MTGLTSNSFVVALTIIQRISARESNDVLNFELKGVLEEFRKRKPHFDVTKTPDVYVDNRSTPEEVKDWMKKKNFSDR